MILLGGNEEVPLGACGHEPQGLDTAGDDFLDLESDGLSGEIEITSRKKFGEGFLPPRKTAFIYLLLR